MKESTVNKSSVNKEMLNAVLSHVVLGFEELLATRLREALSDEGYDLDRLEYRRLSETTYEILYKDEGETKILILGRLPVIENDSGRFKITHSIGVSA